MILNTLYSLHKEATDSLNAIGGIQADNQGIHAFYLLL
ncbi:hypothetical protein VDTJJZMW_CDS_0131 [Pseudomonas phage LPS-5]|uniref:Uncharacterized protein n=1 Tax=Pseudomonas phage Baskent_P3_3B TaxID=3145033 RepID=A0AAU8BD35_9CAUD